MTIRSLLGTSFAASLGALAGWWYQDHARQAATDEQARVRLRAWDHR